MDVGDITISFTTFIEQQDTGDFVKWHGAYDRSERLYRLGATTESLRECVIDIIGQIDDERAVMLEYLESLPLGTGKRARLFCEHGHPVGDDCSSCASTVVTETPNGLVGITSKECPHGYTIRQECPICQ